MRGERISFPFKLSYSELLHKSFWPRSHQSLLVYSCAPTQARSHGRRQCQCSRLCWKVWVSSPNGQSKLKCAKMLPWYPVGQENIKYIFSENKKWKQDMEVLLVWLRPKLQDIWDIATVNTALMFAKMAFKQKRQLLSYHKLFVCNL